jgi:hypothetical protein
MKQHSETLTNDTQICLHSRKYIQYNTLHSRIVYTQRCRCRGEHNAQRAHQPLLIALLHGHAMILHDPTRAGSENKRENGYSPFRQRGHSYLAGMQATPERNKGSSILSHSHSHSNTRQEMAFASRTQNATRTKHKGHAHTSSTVPVAPTQALTPTPTPATRGQLI